MSSRGSEAARRRPDGYKTAERAEARRRDFELELDIGPLSNPHVDLAAFEAVQRELNQTEWSREVLGEWIDPDE